MQAPHRPVPQPNLVPVSFRPSRTTQSSGVSGGASTDTGLPLTVKFIAIAFPPGCPRGAHPMRLVCRFRRPRGRRRRMTQGSGHGSASGTPVGLLHLELSGTGLPASAITVARLYSPSRPALSGTYGATNQQPLLARTPVGQEWAAGPAGYCRSDTRLQRQKGALFIVPNAT